MSDNTLRQNIIDELDFEPSIDAANIGAAVDGITCEFIDPRSLRLLESRSAARGAA